MSGTVAKCPQKQKQHTNANRCLCLFTGVHTRKRIHTDSQETRRVGGGRQQNLSVNCSCALRSQIVLAFSPTHADKAQIAAQKKLEPKQKHKNTVQRGCTPTKNQNTKQNKEMARRSKASFKPRKVCNANFNSERKPKYRII